MLTLGHDLKTQQPVTLDASHARVLLVCGKRGSGKSYTLGVLAEELFLCSPRPCILLVDPMGIFWTLGQAADSSGPGLPVTLLVPGEPSRVYSAPRLAQFQTLGILLQRLTLPPRALSVEAWCALFDLSINEPLGIALARAIQTLTDAGTSFDLRDLDEAVQHDTLAHERTKEALRNRLQMASRWGLFDAHASSLIDSLTTERVYVLDCSVLDYGPQGLRNLVLTVVARQLFTARHAARQQAAIGETPHVPLWLLIDEAHQFVPQGASSLAKDTLIRWVKEGRQPGLSCVLASQQPSSVDQDVLSQCDALIAHKLTNLGDLEAANRLSQAYMGAELRVYVRHLKGPGQAVLVDDARERVAMLQVRARRTRHGGGEA